MCDYETLKTVDLGNDCHLEMAAMHAHFYGHEPQRVIQITYLSPVGKDEGYYTNNSEIYKISDMERATLAFEERLNGKPSEYSSNCTMFNSMFL